MTNAADIIVSIVFAIFLFIIIASITYDYIKVIKFSKKSIEKIDTQELIAGMPIKGFNRQIDKHM